MNIIPPKQAIVAIQNDKIVALPTETVYGLFGLGNSSKSVAQVYKIKNRPADNPLICHFHSFEQILSHTINQPEYLAILVDNFCPGPITFLLELNPCSDLQPATAGQVRICCRIPDNIQTLEILKEINIPLFGPSANSSTRVSGTNCEIIFADLGDKIVGIVDGGECEVGLESTIIDCSAKDVIKILRPGAIGKTEIEKVLNNQNIKIIENQASDKTTPGAKYRHYSPTTKIVRTEKTVIQINDTEIINSPEIKYILGFEEDLSTLPNSIQKINLGSVSIPNEIAHNLFQKLFDIDKLNQEMIYFYFGSNAEKLFLSESSIEKAIVNRLDKIFTSNNET